MKLISLHILAGALCLAISPLAAQVIPERQADFIARSDGAFTLFAPVLPPLEQIAGAPKAFYEYYWEFGDGSFGFEQYPKRVYADTLEKEVFFMATGKYDNGKAPKSRKKGAAPSGEKPKSQVAQAVPAILPNDAAAIGMRAVRNPRAGEELVCIMAYANQTPMPQSGKLHLFFNQIEYKNEHFQFLEGRTHFGEQEEAPMLSHAGPPLLNGGVAGASDLKNWFIPDMNTRLDPDKALIELQKAYKSEKVWRFKDLQAGELRHLFVSLQSTERMLADTHAIITMTALLVSDDLQLAEQYVLEMEIVPSHDPNFIAISERRLSFRRVQDKELVYKVHFQNNGEGPAKTVEITCDVPPGLDPASLRVLDAYPLQSLCPEGLTDVSCLDTALVDGRLVFTFRNIYLPGTRQEGAGDPDSTKGFVKYSLAPDEKIKKMKLDARASIVFDKNPPIRTNGVGAKFKPGLSPGLAAGWNIAPGDEGRNHPAIGAILSPFSPYKAYLQWEIWAGFPTRPLISVNAHRDTVSWIQDFQGGFVARIDSVTTYTKRSEENSVYLSVVPLQARKNLSHWLGIGAGLLLDLNLQFTSIGNEVKTQRFVYTLNGEPMPDFYQENTSSSSVEDKNHTFHPAIFADIHIGRVRRGPSLGLRGVAYLARESDWYASVFGGWKF
jgi:hypothetical protein